MRRLFTVAILIVTIIALPTIPVLASDPPDMQVDIGITTSGNVDMDVGINAGGDVNVTVDGVDFKQTANTANDAYNNANSILDVLQNGHTMWDYLYYWEITGIGRRVEGQISELQAATNLLFTAEAMLIEGQEINKEQLAKLYAYFDDLKLRDEEIWNQLMYGAEAHLALLEIKVADYIATNDVQTNELERQIYALAEYAYNIDRAKGAEIASLQFTIWMISSLLVIGLIVSLIALVHHRRKYQV